MILHAIQSRHEWNWILGSPQHTPYRQGYWPDRSAWHRVRAILHIFIRGESGGTLSRLNRSFVDNQRVIYGMHHTPAQTRYQC